MIAHDDKSKTLRLFTCETLKSRLDATTSVQILNTTNNEDTTVSYRVIILRPDKTPSIVTLTPRFKTTDEASMYGFFRADDYDFELEECTVAANCVLRDNKLVYVA